MALTSLAENLRREGVYDFRLQPHFSCVFSGPSSSGKTTLCLELLRNREDWISGKISKIIYCYTYLSDDLVEFQRKYPHFVLTDSITEAKEMIVEDSILIIDDKMIEMTNRTVQAQINDIFIRGVHHLKYNCILLVQNLFHESLRVVLSNLTYMCVFNNPKNKFAITYLAKQISPENFKYIVSAFKDVCSKDSFNYLFFDFSQRWPERYRVRSSIYPDPTTIIYAPE